MTKSDSGDWVKTEEKPSDFDEGLGDDWESAFQAEEFMFSPGEGEGNGFFREKSGPSTAYEFTPPDDGELAGVPDLEQTPGKAAPGAAPASTSSGSQAAPTAQQQAPGPTPSRWRRLQESFFTLPLVHRLALGGTTLLILLLTLVLLWPSPRRMEPDSHQTAAPGTPRQAAMPEQPGPADMHRDWQLTPFLLPVAASDPAGKTTFLEVDLSLVLALAPKDQLPEDKKLFVRDLIYRYYREQTPDTLRRFALVRGEMSRTLLAWLRKHWPEAPIKAVVFSKYQLT